MKPETILQKKIRSYLENKGAWVVKYHGNEFSEIGVPDLLVCYKGKFIGLEVKVKPNKPSKIQEAQIKNIIYAGGIALVIDDTNWKTLIDQIIYENN